ncbi:MAG: xylulokinase [Ktedonobacterales bacterium]
MMSHVARQLVYLGLDLGTSSLKALAIDAAGGVLAIETASYPLMQLRPGWLEQRPDDWWTAACDATRRLLARPELAPCQVEAIGLSGQMHGATLVDAGGHVLRPALIWADARGAAELDAFAAHLAPAETLRITGSLPHASSTLAKLLWLRAHEPATFGRAAQILTAKDELRRRLTGAYATDITDASGTLLCDIHERRWSPAILDALGVDVALLPPVHDSGAITGRVTPAAAAATGLPAGTPVVAGGGGAACAAYGAGLGRDPVAATAGADVLVSLGTAGQIFALLDQPQIDSRGRVHTLCSVLPERWHLMGAILAAGHTLSWLAQAVGDPRAPEAGADGARPDIGQLLTEASGVLPGADGLLFLPYLLGERSPHMDPTARGAFVGLTSAHTRAHLARAAVEGVALALRDSLSVFHELGLTPGRVLLAGAAARDALWRQVLAGVLALPVVTGATEHGSAYGAALLAARALGAGAASPPGGMPDATPPLASSVTRPEASAVALYDRLYAAYRPLYGALRPTMDALARLHVDRPAAGDAGDPTRPERRA